MKISMEEAIYDFPDHLALAEHLSRGISLPTWDVAETIVLGMGGSAIGGDFVGAVADQTESRPILVNRSSDLPGFVNSQTLVIAVSYSGTTQETLTAVEKASQKTKHIVTVSTGGALKQFAAAHQFPHIEIKGGLMPRAALAYTFVPLLRTIKHFFGLPDDATDLSEAFTVLKSIREQLSKENNSAQTLAKKLCNKIPVIYAPSPSFAAAARRFKCQVNENAKQPAYFEIVPESNHNAIVGFTHPLAVHRDLSIVILRDSDENALTKKSIEWTKKAMAQAGSAVHELWSQGKGFVARLLSFSYQADYVSLYLAKENKVDPIEINIIDRLKKELAGAGSRT